MRPGESPGDDDRRLHEGERRIGERLARQLKDTPGRRQNPVWHAHADVRTVVGRNGNPRLVLLVATCPGCRMPHLHLARLPFSATVRKGACGATYMVHAMNAVVAA